MRKSVLVFSSIILGLACAHPPPSGTTGATQASSSGDQQATPCGDAQVFFAAGESQLDSGARERLDGYAGCLVRHEIDTVFIAGMTDPEGAADENLRLGRARAFAVAEYLHEHGCQVDFVIRSYGEEGALTSPPLWPLERSAEVTAVGTD